MASTCFSANELVVVTYLSQRQSMLPHPVRPAAVHMMNQPRLRLYDDASRRCCLFVREVLDVTVRCSALVMPW